MPATLGCRLPLETCGALGGEAAESDHGGEAVELATGVGWIEEVGPLSRNNAVEKESPMVK